jgi:hydrogenase maturation protease
LGAAHPGLNSSQPTFWSHFLKPTIIIGYGNPDREDDGVAWHILAELTRRLGRPVPTEVPEGFYPSGETPDFLFVLQLTPEMSETLAAYARVCFVDAHTGRVPQEVSIAPVMAQAQTSPFTHHMTAEMLLAMTEEIYDLRLDALLASVRGYQFGFTVSLSPRTAELAMEAADQIWEWLHQETPATDPSTGEKEPNNEQ